MGLGHSASFLFNNLCAVINAKMIVCQIYFGMTFRNQRHGEFVDESSIFLELHGLTSSGMALGKVLGFSRDDRTKTGKKHKIAAHHLKGAREMACQATKKVQNYK